MCTKYWTYDAGPVMNRTQTGSFVMEPESRQYSNLSFQCILMLIAAAGSVLLKTMDHCVLLVISAGFGS